VREIQRNFKKKEFFEIFFSVYYIATLISRMYWDLNFKEKIEKIGFEKFSFKVATY